MKNKVCINLQEDLIQPVWLEKVELFLLKVLSKLNFENEEISVLFCNNSYIQELNKSYRSIDNATDVLSFENDFTYEEDGITIKVVGDIVISLEMISENARYFDTTDNLELKRLLVHGVLHLNGMDHGDEHIQNNVEPECEMLVLQEKLLKELDNEIIIE